MKFQLQAGRDVVAVRVLEREPAELEAEEVDDESAVKYAGKAPSAMKSGTKNVSKPPPRRHAATMPTAVPSMNARTKAMPTSAIEYGSVRPTTSETFVG